MPAVTVDTAKFASTGRNYRAILLAPADHPHHITGERVPDQRGFTAEFSRHPFEPLADGSDGTFQWPPLPTDPEAAYVGEPGDSGFPVYVDPVSGATVDVVAKLRAHPDFNVRFCELGPDPAELQREQSELLKEITRCAAQADLDRLAEIYDSEENGHKREPVLTAAMEGMRAVEEALAAEREPAAG